MDVIENEILALDQEITRAKYAHEELLSRLTAEHDKKMIKLNLRRADKRQELQDEFEKRVDVEKVYMKLYELQDEYNLSSDECETISKTFSNAPMESREFQMLSDSTKMVHARLYDYISFHLPQEMGVRIWLGYSAYQHGYQFLIKASFSFRRRRCDQVSALNLIPDISRIVWGFLW